MFFFTSHDFKDLVKKDVKQVFALLTVIFISLLKTDLHFNTSPCYAVHKIECECNFIT